MGRVDAVLCFDRDHTVDVRSHPERAAVAPSWVWHWAHDLSEVDVRVTVERRHAG